MYANLRFSSVSSEPEASILYDSTNANPRFFLPSGTLYCNNCNNYQCYQVERVGGMVWRTLASHLVTPGTSRLRPVSVKSRTMSGNTAMKFLDSSLLTAVPTMAGGTGGVRATLMHLCDENDNAGRLGKRGRLGSVRPAPKPERASHTYRDCFPWTATVRRPCGRAAALRHSGPANESILFIATRKTHATHDAAGTVTEHRQCRRRARLLTGAYRDRHYTDVSNRFRAGGERRLEKWKGGRARRPRSGVSFRRAVHVVFPLLYLF